MKINHSKVSSLMKKYWHPLLAKLITKGYFNSVKIVSLEKIPSNGPRLYLGLHRNGAVDGWVYASVLPGKPVFMISTQLQRSWLSKVFFTGIAVARSKDKESNANNRAALNACMKHLENQGDLFIFPEGTSHLGHKHLPFKRGAAHLILEYLSTHPYLEVVPLGIHYDAPTKLGSNVEVLVGKPIKFINENNDITFIHSVITDHLEQLSINVENDSKQQYLEKLARIASDIPGVSYSNALIKLSQSMPHSLNEQAKVYSSTTDATYYPNNIVFEFILLLMLTPLMIVAFLANLLSIVSTWLFSYIKADKPNVISLWRILIGAPLMSIYVFAILVYFALSNNYLTLFGYLLVSITSLRLYGRFKKSLYGCFNWVIRHRHRQMHIQLQALLHDSIV